MPKITGPGVVSVKGTAPVEPEPTEEEVPSSPGNSSSASSESTTKTSETTSKATRPRARRTGTRSTRAAKGSTTVRPDTSSSSD